MTIIGLEGTYTEPNIGTGKKDERQSNNQKFTLGRRCLHSEPRSFAKKGEDATSLAEKIAKKLRKGANKGVAKLEGVSVRTPESERSLAVILPDFEIFSWREYTIDELSLPAVTAVLKDMDVPTLSLSPTAVRTSDLEETVVEGMSGPSPTKLSWTTLCTRELQRREHLRRTEGVRVVKFDSAVARVLWNSRVHADQSMDHKRRKETQLQTSDSLSSVTTNISSLGWA